MSLQVNVYLKNSSETALVPFKTWICHLGPYQAFTLLQGVSVHVEPSTFHNKCMALARVVPAVFVGQRYIEDTMEEVIIVVSQYTLE